MSNSNYLSKLSSDIVNGLFYALKNDAKSWYSLQNAGKNDNIDLNEFAKLFTKLANISSSKDLENLLLSDELDYETLSYFLTSETIKSYKDFKKEEEKNPNKGELANSADCFLILFFYSFHLYSKFGMNALLIKETYEEIKAITEFSHANELVYIGNTFFVGLVFSALSYRHKKRRFPNSSYEKIVDDVIEQVSTQFLREEFKNTKRYFVGIAPLFYELHKEIPASRNLKAIDKRLLQTNNYVIDFVTTLFSLLLKGYKDNSYQELRNYIVKRKTYTPLFMLLFDVLSKIMEDGLIEDLKEDYKVYLNNEIYNLLTNLTAPLVNLLESQNKENEEIRNLQRKYLTSVL